MAAPPPRNDTAKYQPPHRFRHGRRGNDTARGGSQRNSSNNTSSNHSRDGGAQSQQNRRGGKQQQQQHHSVNRSQQQQQQHQQTPQKGVGTQNGPALTTEQHVPLNGFNAAEVEKFLAQGVDTKAQVYKPQTGSEGVKSGNPWGAKPGNMANNKDFWLELRKQVTALQKQASGGLQGG